MSIQAFMNGGLARKKFLAYNTLVGANVVNLTRQYNTGKSYSTRNATGNNIDKAFEEINNNEGSSIFTVNTPDYGNGNSIKTKFDKLSLLLAAGAMNYDLDFSKVINSQYIGII